VLGPYEGVLGACVRRAKYRPDPRLAQDLGRRLARAARGRLPRVDAVVPVPIPLRRRLTRGFDQAEILARPVAMALGAPLVPALGRVDPAEQAGRSHRERLRAARQAWRVRRPVAGPVLLVDDVVTTGATAAACADALLCEGASRVWLLAVAGRGA
jgi:ComF family protein